MKKAIVTIAGGEYFERMAALTHPTLSAYAKKIGADFLVWSDLAGYQIPEYKKTEVRALLEHYDRVLYVDTDVIIRDDAPDVFAVVPEDSLGVLEESRYYDRRLGVLRFMEHVGFDSTLWDGKYYNAGIFVCSRCHREMFARPPVEYDHFRDQTWFNTMLCDRKIKVFPLPHRFNRVLAFDRFYGEDRHDAWFLHYAGVGVVLSREEILDLIAHDLEVWRQNSPAHRYPHHVALVVEGDVGEQVTAEPAIRYARDVLCRGDDLAVVASRSELFAHLGLPVYRTLADLPHEAKYLKRRTRAGDDAAADPLPGVRAHQVHGVTRAALALLGVELPQASRQPRIEVSAAALAAVERKVAGDLRDLVLVHAGCDAAGNTFPSDVWQTYVDALVAAGFRVALVGDRTGDFRVARIDGANGLDLVDQLTLEELIALVSQAKVLVANDSPLVQIAGAFDNWIALVASSRHPDYVLPWRNGSQTWRTGHFERAPLYERYLHKPSGESQPQLVACDEATLRACLPEAADIVAFVNAAG